MTATTNDRRAPLPPPPLLAGMAIASPVALNIFAPVMPELTEHFNTTSFTIQLGFTLYLLTLALGQLVAGPLADHYGRKPVLLWGFVLHILGCAIAALSTELWQLLLARVFQAAGGCTGMLLARSIVLDRYGKDRAAGVLGYITLGIASAQALAPTLGGYLSLNIGWASVFWLSMLLGSLVWLGALLRLHEAERADTAANGLQQSLLRYKAVLSSPSYIAYALSSTLIACGFFIFITCAPFIVSDKLLGSSADYGNWFLFVAGGFWLGSLTAGNVSATQGTGKMMALGNLISGLGALLMLSLFLLDAVSYVALFVPMGLFTFGRGLSQPSAQAAAISNTQGAVATAAGLLGCLQLLLGSVLAQLTPLLLEISLKLLPVTLVSLALLASLSHKAGDYFSRKP